jgi:hypothetical protein
VFHSRCVVVVAAVGVESSLVPDLKLAPVLDVLPAVQCTGDTGRGSSLITNQLIHG